jgi:hypothetical protein
MITEEIQKVKQGQRDNSQMTSHISQRYVRMVRIMVTLDYEPG